MRQPPLVTCGARTRRGTACKRPAGAGTPFTSGRCFLHGGRSPRSLQARARETLIADAGQFLGDELDIHPAEALLACVRVASGELAYWRARAARIADCEELGADALTIARLTADSLDRVGRLARAALDTRASGVVGAELDAMSDLVAEALEAALRGLDLEPEQRDAAVARAVARLEGLEGQALPVLTIDDPHQRKAYA